METFLDYLLKSAGVLSIFILVYHFLLRRLTFFNTNRWFLLLGIVASVAFPLVEITQTVYVEETPPVYSSELLMTPMAAVLEMPQEPIPEPFDYWELALYLYIAVIVFFLGKMVVELLSLRRLIRSGQHRRSGRFVMVTLSRKLTPFSFFHYICYSDTDQLSPELDLIMDHEKVHAREWHSLDLLASHLFSAVFWINPLAWLIKRQIGENLEFIADAKAKIQNTTGISYVRTLLSTAASHMQPALANNFFTPFIKKRILMLQKEASAKWNAYKYALILPVIVLFLYSFNVVEEIEYVKSEPAVSWMEFVENPVTSNSYVSSNETERNTSNLVFDISAGTTNEELERYAAMINDYADYEVKFTDFERNNQKQLGRISVSTKFPGKSWEKNFTLGKAPISLILITAAKQELIVNDNSIKSSLKVSSKGTEIFNGDRLLYGDLVKTENEPVVYNPDFDHTITFTIDATSTKDYLEEKKTYLKNNYNVDFSYSRVKRKNGRIVRIKISLDDNNGYKGSQSYNNNVGIPKICVSGVIKENTKTWSMGDCDDVPTNSSYSYSTNLGHIVYNEAHPINIDSLIKNAKGTFKAYKMDSLQQFIQFEGIPFDKLKIDSLRNYIQTQMKSKNWDSIQLEMQTQLDSLDAVQNRFGFIQFKNPPNVYSFENGFSGPVTTKEELRRGINLEKENPKLIIIDGKEASTEEMLLVNNNLIKSVSVLKDNEATRAYGDKGKNGVIIIEMKSKEEQLESKALQEKAEAKRAEMMEMIEEKEEMRSNYQRRRDSIAGLRAELVQENQVELREKSAQMKARSERLKSFRSDTFPNDQIEYEIHLDDMSEERFKVLQKQLEQAGHTFNLRTHRMKKDRLVKLKYEIDGLEYTYVTDKGVKELWIKFFKGNTSPSISMIPFD